VEGFYIDTRGKNYRSKPGFFNLERGAIGKEVITFVYFQQRAREGKKCREKGFFSY